MQSIPRNTRFLSTPSARRATGRPAGRLPHPQISIHALREEGDPTVPPLAIDDGQFLSTPSARRATPSGAGRKPSKNISIHALREEGDIDELREIAVEEDFYPRPPRGGRRVPSALDARQREFLSTPSARRATTGGQMASPAHGNFYPRPPRGGRREPESRFCCCRKFLSTPSARRATCLPCF